MSDGTTKFSMIGFSLKEDETKAFAFIDAQNLLREPVEEERAALIRSVAFLLFQRDLYLEAARAVHTAAMAMPKNERPEWMQGMVEIVEGFDRSKEGKAAQS